MSCIRANLTFSEFCNKVADIFSSMPPSRRHEFRIAIATYFKQKTEPKSGWKKCITEIIGNSETQVTWPSSYLDDIKNARGDITRTIAFYYYMQSLTHDLSFAKAVDKILFLKEPTDRRTFASANGGMPVFEAIEKAFDENEHSWKSALLQWEFVCSNSQPVNGLLASLSIEHTQAGDTREPIALIAEVHMRPAYEHESGMELRFNSVHIELNCEAKLPAKLNFVISMNKSSENANGFFLEGSGTHPYVTVSHYDNGLNGNYISDTLALLSPNCQSCSFRASLRARIIQTNVKFPVDMDLPSKMKREIIRRMVEKRSCRSQMLAESSLYMNCNMTYLLQSFEADDLARPKYSCSSWFCQRQLSRACKIVRPRPR